MKHLHRLFIPIACLLLFVSCSRQQSNSTETVTGTTPQSQSQPVSKADRDSCLLAGRESLGPHAEMLKCGHFTDAEHLEAVAAIRVRGLKDDRNGIPISKLVILRQDKSQWRMELNADKAPTNSAGYVGVHFIYDPDPIPYYRVNFSDRGAKWAARNPSQFTLVLSPMTRDGKVDVGDEGIGIGWNPAVGRFQEIEPNGEEFAPEVKNPKHIRSSK